MNEPKRVEDVMDKFLLKNLTDANERRNFLEDYLGFEEPEIGFGSASYTIDIPDNDWTILPVSFYPHFGVSYGNPDGSVTVAKKGYYRLNLNISAGFAGSDTMDIAMFINDTMYNTAIKISGSGANDRVAASWGGIIDIYNDYDKITFKAKNSDAGILHATVDVISFHLEGLQRNWGAVHYHQQP